MFLHPREAVRRSLDANHRGFAVAHHILDQAAQQTATAWECYDDLAEVHGATLASDFRGRVRAIDRGGLLLQTSLRLRTVNNCGQHLYDSVGTRYRILERPLSQVSPGRLLPVSEPEIDTLFGPVAHLDYELAVLWTMNYRAKSLQTAVLAAVADLDNPKKAAIFAEAALPAPLAIRLSLIAEDAVDDLGGPDEGTAPLGFDDLFGREDEGTGESS